MEQEEKAEGCLENATGGSLSGTDRRSICVGAAFSAAAAVPHAPVEASAALKRDRGLPQESPVSSSSSSSSETDDGDRKPAAVAKEAALESARDRAIGAQANDTSSEIKAKKQQTVSGATTAGRSVWGTPPPPGSSSETDDRDRKPAAVAKESALESDRDIRTKANNSAGSSEITAKKQPQVCCAKTTGGSVWGTPPPPPAVLPEDDGDVSPALLAQLDAAVCRLPAAERRAYETALQTVARAVWDREAGPVMFLRVENGNVAAAATRMVHYWDHRLDLFGAERAYRPVLDLSGTGALTADDVHLIRTYGRGVELPNDTSGRRVLCFDDALLPSEFTAIFGVPCRRATFYWLTAAAAASPASQTDGVMILRVLRKADIVGLKGIADAAKFKYVMPYKARSNQFCCVPPVGRGRKHFMETFVPVYLQNMGKHVTGDSRVHVEEEPGSLLPKLLACGFTREGLPTSLGGTLVVDRVDALTEKTSGSSSSSSSSGPARASGCERDGPIPAGVAPARADGASPETCTTANALLANDGANTATSVSLANLAREIERLSDDERLAYDEALGVADPHIFDGEANPALFMRVEDNRAPQAAKRLVDYWALRKRLFGDRAFRSVLDLSGDGALSPDDMAPFASVLPKHVLPSDTAGRSVVYCDDADLPSNCAKLYPSRSRLLFYAMNAAAVATPLSQTEGVIWLRVLRRPSFESVRCLELHAQLDELVPTKLHASYVCCVPPAGSRKYFMEQFLPIYLHSLGKDGAGFATVLVGDTSGSLLDQLEACGLRREGLPSSLGGDLIFVAAAQGPDQKPRVAELDTASEAAASAGALACLSEAAQRAVLAERKARKRRMDVLYARQRRQREKGHETQLQDQCSVLSKANDKLRDDNDRLEKMLSDAKAEVAFAQFGAAAGYSVAGSTQANLPPYREHALRQFDAMPERRAASIFDSWQREQLMMLTSGSKGDPLESATAAHALHRNLPRQLASLNQLDVSSLAALQPPYRQLQEQRPSSEMIARLQRQLEAESNARQAAAAASQRAILHHLAALQENEMQEALDAQIRQQLGGRLSQHPNDYRSTLNQLALSMEADEGHRPDLAHLLAAMEPQSSAAPSNLMQESALAQIQDLLTAGSASRTMPLQQSLGSIERPPDLLHATSQAAELEYLLRSKPSLSQEISNMLATARTTDAATIFPSNMSKEYVLRMMEASAASPNETAGPGGSVFGAPPPFPGPFRDNGFL